MTIKINYQQLPRDLARNIILEDNPYKDDTSFVGQMLKHSSWNDVEYSKFEDGFLKYIDEHKSGYKPEVLPIIENILQIYDKYFDYSYVDFHTCLNDDLDIEDRFENFEWLMNNFEQQKCYNIELQIKLQKTIQYNIDNNTHQSTIIGISGFDELNKERYLPRIGFMHALVHMNILHIGCVRQLSEIYNPYKIYCISQDIDCLPYVYRDKYFCNFYKNNNTIVAEAILCIDTLSSDFYKANNNMSIIITKKFHKDFYNIFDSSTSLVSKERLIDLVNKHDAFALWFNNKSIEEYELEILYGKQVKIGDCNG